MSSATYCTLFIHIFLPNSNIIVQSLSCRPHCYCKKICCWHFLCTLQGLTVLPLLWLKRAYNHNNNSAYNFLLRLSIPWECVTLIILLDCCCYLFVLAFVFCVADFNAKPWRRKRVWWCALIAWAACPRHQLESTAVYIYMHLAKVFLKFA